MSVTSLEGAPVSLACLVLCLGSLYARGSLKLGFASLESKANSLGSTRFSGSRGKHTQSERLRGELRMNILKFTGTVPGLFGSPRASERRESIHCQSVNPQQDDRNFVGSSILLVYLYEHPGKFLAWQSATLGLAAWANTSFTGIGTTAWNDIRPLAATSHPVLSVSEFLNQLHLDGGASSASASAEAVSGNSIGAMLSKLCLGTWYFNEEDGLLVQSRRQLLHHALPLHPRLRLVHSSILSFISLLSLAVPALLVGYCMLQTPQLQLCEVVGGSIQPEFDPWASHHYVRVADAWKEVITFNFEMELGQASSYAFCCGSSSCAAQAFGDRQPSNHLLMEARVSQGEFGTCSLKLRGLRQREYLFTILAARSISIEAKLGRTSASFAEHPTQGHLYQSSMALPSRNAQLSFFAAMVLDQTHMRLSPSAKICRRDNQCDTVEASRL